MFYVSLESSAPASEVSEPSIRTEWRALLILALWFAAVAIAVGVHRNTPVIDDWTYAWSVERLLDDGRIEVLDWSAVYPLVHSLWGAAWSLVLGFSFATLRFSTLTLSLLATCALYLILRELDARPRAALLGALTVAANPAVLLLSSSFMTDMPFVAWTLMALLCYIRAMRRGRARLLWWGGAWACIAFLDRQMGVLTPLAALPMLVRPGKGEMKRSTVLLALAATGAVMLTSSVVMVSLVRPTGEMMKLVERLDYVLSIPLRKYLIYNLYLLPSMSFYALPALLAMAATRRSWRRPALFAVMLGVGALMLVLMGEVPVALRPGSTWTLIEVGGSRGLINGLRPASNTTAIEIVLRGAALVAFALALLSLRGQRTSKPLARAEPAPPSLPGRLLEAVRRIPVTPRAPLVVYLGAYLFVANVLWMYNDRYLIVLLPVIVALALGESSRGVEVPRLAWVAAAIFALVAVVGTRDALRFNESVRDTRQALMDSGVPPSDIDAGYAWNGWTLYAHPENLSGGMTVDTVPWITSEERRSSYILSTSALAGYDVVREVAWTGDAPWPGPDRLLVLKRHAASH